jgi:hypothetical protein
MYFNGNAEEKTLRPKILNNWGGGGHMAFNGI